MASAIEFDHVSKLYRLGLVSTGALKDDLHRFWVTKVMKGEDPYLKIGDTNDRSTKGNSNYVWALRDIDFKVEQGDVVGIIGKNGAGKSTLLKLLSRVTGPTTGQIRAHGRIGSLLEVGTGFHPEMTGRENIFMNGAILGMSHREIASKLDEIVDFSGCERYIDTPVKRYSSGMTVRLGFAVAAHLDPEILVVDEVLAVGDAEFQKKAIGKMQDVSKGEGRTVLFVSHNMDSVQSLCKTGIILNKGTVQFTGAAEDAVKTYLSANTLKHDYVWVNKNNIVSGPLKVNSIWLEDKDGKIVKHSLKDNDTVRVLIDVELYEIHFDLTFGVQLFNETGKSIYRSLDTDLDQDFNSRLSIGRNIIKAELPIGFLRPGEYCISIDASLHNRFWIIEPSPENEMAISFIKVQGTQFSFMQHSESVIAPLIKWDSSTAF